MTTLVIVLAFATGFAAALNLVGYGVPGGLRRIYHLTRYRLGLCRCWLCREEVR